MLELIVLQEDLGLLEKKYIILLLKNVCMGVEHYYVHTKSVT